MSDLRKDFAQNGATDAQYMVRLWEKGADTILLHSTEMNRIKGIIENPSVFEALQQTLETAAGDTHPLLDWITAAWRLAFPSLDLTQFETSAKWHTYSEAINICRKLGVLWHIYNQAPTPQAAPMTPAFIRVVIKGAPPHLQMSLTTGLQASQTIGDAIRHFKQFRELEAEKVVSFQTQVRRPPPRKDKPTSNWKRLRNIRFRQFGNRNTMPIRPNGRGGPFKRIIGRPATPFPRQNNFLGQRPGNRRPWEPRQNQRQGQIGPVRPRFRNRYDPHRR